MNADNYDKEPQQRIEQLEEDLQLCRQRLREKQQRLETQRQEIIRKLGPEFLAVIEGDSTAKISIIPVVKKVVFQDEQGNVIKTDAVVVAKLVEIRLNDSSH